MVQTYPVIFSFLRFKKISGQNGEKVRTKSKEKLKENEGNCEKVAIILYCEQ